MKDIKLLDEDVYLEMLTNPRGTGGKQTEFTHKYLSKYNPTKDSYGNLYVAIGKSDVAFMSHLDTVHRADCDYVPVMAKEGFASVDQDFAKKYNANCLGADCTTGVFIMMNMIENDVPGLYCFFRDEESGCLGSTWSARNLNWKKINHAISFDRMGTESIITHQMGVNTASEEFTTELSTRLIKHSVDMVGDDSGAYTDSNSFVGVIPNCTNLSVGYYNQHTVHENQDLNFLLNIIEVYCKLDWEGLPIGTLEDDSYFFDEDEYEYVDELPYVFKALLDVYQNNPDIEAQLWEMVGYYDYADKESDPFYVGS